MTEEKNTPPENKLAEDKKQPPDNKLAEDKKQPPKATNRKKVLWGLTAGFLVIALLVFILWLFIWRFRVSTEDSYVQGNQIVVTSQISGYICSVTVQDTDVVEQGHTLVTLDSIDRKIALETAKNNLAQTVRNVAQMFENVEMLKAEVEVRKADLVKTGLDYQHRKNLVDTGGVSKEDFQHSETGFIASFASVLSTRHQLQGALALVENTSVETHPLVKKAQETLREAYINLNRCTIRAPVKGIVTVKKAQVGESISPDTPLMTIVPLDQIWVDANFKEVQLKNVRIGQPAHVTADLYGGSVVYHGKVIGISAATGSVLSILPPQNATGNWIKIVQRLPVRIALNPDEIEKHPLRLGLSMDVKVDIRDTRGRMMPFPAPPGALFVTDIFDKQDKGADALIQEIVKTNSAFSFKVGEENNLPNLNFEFHSSESTEIFDESASLFPKRIAEGTIFEEKDKQNRRKNR